MLFLIYFVPYSALDEESGEIPVAFVVRRVGSDISEETVMDYLAAQVFHQVNEMSSGTHTSQTNHFTSYVT